MSESEKVLERHLYDKIRELGGWCVKHDAAFRRGFPDRMLLLPGGVTIFVELKTSGKSPTMLQTHTLEQLRKLGYACYVIDSTDSLELVLNQVKKCISSHIPIKPGR